MSEGRVLASTEVAADRRSRRRGLLGRDGLDGALVLTKTRWVHTVCMRFPIDVAYVDEADTVIRTVRMSRWRIGRPVPRASWVIEARAGAFDRWDLRVGDPIELRDGPADDDPATDRHAERRRATDGHVERRRVPVGGRSGADGV